METKSSKRSGVWGINLLHKYQTDLFFRTTCHIIILQLVLTAAIIGIAWFAMERLVDEVSQALLSNITSMLQGQGLAPEKVFALLDTIHITEFQTVSVILVAVILGFSFTMAYIALTPTRRSLERQKRFINNIAHELRTPLAIVRTNTDVILLDKNIPQGIESTLKRNIHELDRISEIMNNLISLSTMIRSEHVPFLDVNLATVTQNAIDTLSTIGLHKGVTVVLRTHTDKTVLGNATALEQVAFNLIKNALTHTAKGGVVTVTIEPGDPRYTNLIVADTGMGISREDFFHIFEPFYRSRKAERGTGSGLGLTIVNDIVQMHRGKISMRSAVGRGTTVTVAFPQSAQASSSSEAGDAPNEISMDFSKSLVE